MGLMISICGFLISAYITYWLFDNYGFKSVWILTTVFSLILNAFRNRSFFSFPTIIPAICLAIIVALINTAIEYFVYNRSNSYWGYVGGLVLLGLAVVIAVIAGGAIIAMVSG